VQGCWLDVPDVVPLREYLAALRESDQALAVERDRRYSEVKAAEEKALKVKEEADRTALGLQRETQQYKDEKANELREQISRERGLYVTREELAGSMREIQALIKPLTDYVNSDAGRNAGAAGTRTDQRLNIGQVVAVMSVTVAAITLLLLYIRK
jgi:vacuolar-type H+-ATPase subunit H